MTELEYVLRHGGLTPKRLLKKISRRGFTASILGGLAGSVASRLVGSPASQLMGNPAVSYGGDDFTIAIIPDPQFLAESCPDNLGDYYGGMMNWIVDHKNMVFTSGPPAFNANIKAVIGVGDCVNLTSGTPGASGPSGVDECKNAETAWTILDTNGIAFTTPPGNHDYVGTPSSRSNLGAQFANGFFSATNRSSVYGSGIDLGGGDVARWIGSFDNTGSNTAVQFVISGIKMLILAMDFFAGNAEWAWAHDVMAAFPDSECYITTHAWMTKHGTHFQRQDQWGPDAYSMAPSPYSNSTWEAWNQIGVNTWPNLVGVFSGHDISGNIVETAGALPEWYWQYVPIKSSSSKAQTVHQLFANAQQLDAACDLSVSRTTGAGQIASVFLLSRRPRLGVLEGRMISTYSGDWFTHVPGSQPGTDGWSASETLLFSVPFNGRHVPTHPATLTSEQ